MTWRRGAQEAPERIPTDKSGQGAGVTSGQPPVRMYLTFSRSLTSKNRFKIDKRVS